MIEKFKKIFEGLTIAYGQYQKGEKDDNGKQKGKAFIVRKQVSKELFENHLKGDGPALGIIPITETNDCRWGCIDVDEYNLDHKSLISNIRKLDLPLIVCRSKSGGAHVFLFAKEFISASLMQSTLKKISKVLGYEGCEIFPKQTEILVERGDTGNFLNLPYYNEMKGLRYAYDDSANALSLEHFCALYDQRSLGERGIREIKINQNCRKRTL